MRLIFMGYHNVGYACLEELIDLCAHFGDEIVAVVTHADDPQENRWFASVRDLAFDNYLPVYQPRDPNDPGVCRGHAGSGAGFSLFLLLSPHAEKAAAGLAQPGAP